MERHLKWKGILIEPDQKSFNQLVTKRRHAWALPVCLSTKPFPTKVSCITYQHHCVNPKTSLTYIERSPLSPITRQEKSTDKAMKNRGK